MALAHNNPLLTHVHGRLGKFMVIKSYSYGTVISAYPNMSKVKPSKKQLAEKDRFANAVHYAKGIMADPKKKAAMKARLPKGKSVYHAAIAEYMRREVPLNTSKNTAPNRRLSMISVVVIVLCALTGRAEGVRRNASQLPVASYWVASYRLAGFPGGRVSRLQDWNDQFSMGRSADGENVQMNKCADVQIETINLRPSTCGLTAT
jgi:hypothetical protein